MDSSCCVHGDSDVLDLDSQHSSCGFTLFLIMHFKWCKWIMVPYNGDHSLTFFFVRVLCGTGWISINFLPHMWGLPDWLWISNPWHLRQEVQRSQLRPFFLSSSSREIVSQPLMMVWPSCSWCLDEQRKTPCHDKASCLLLFHSPLASEIT